MKFGLEAEIAALRQQHADFRQQAEQDIQQLKQTLLEYRDRKKSKIAEMASELLALAEYSRSLRSVIDDVRRG